ncbi:MAG TPA: SUMF1/EgtB/PvdO family nonheme iron enzyme, partial [Spirochaetota bacterium]|nr:SUMF1/EgtB/PvdO family nonheme iron enzyme [Spirochaetota bacterium]
KSATVSISNSTTDFNPYTFSLTGTGAEQVATPTLSLDEKEYATTQFTTINCVTSGATIRYTTDGSDPTKINGTIYSGGDINIIKPTIIKVIAYKNGMVDSPVVTKSYYIIPVFTMIDVPTSGITFNFNDTKSVTLTPFKMSNYEVTYKLWEEVRVWAVANGYTFGSSGVKGSTGSGSDYQPVTTIDWYDSVVWCNAYSEKSGLTPCYYTSTTFVTGNVYRNSSTHTNIDNSWVKWDATGYRLPTEAEWEYAARYKDGTIWTPFDYASGATADYNNASETDKVAWYSDNSCNTTLPVGFKQANALGLYDMSGNIFEWNWDWYGNLTNTPEMNPRGAISGSRRIFRGGGWSNTSVYCKVGDRCIYLSYDLYNYLGFRAVRSN